MDRIVESTCVATVTRAKCGRATHSWSRASALVVAAVLAVLLPACASPTAVPTPSPAPEATPTATVQALPTSPVSTPTPEAVTPSTAGQSYVNRLLGVQLAYPGDWLLRETDKGATVGTGEELLAGGEMVRGAGLVLQAQPLPNAEWEDLDQLALDRASVFRSEGMEISDPQPISIDGQQGSLIELQGQLPLSDKTVRGLVAVTIWDRWLYSFAGLSLAEEWPTYGPILQAIIQSARFSPREEPHGDPDAWEPDDTLEEASPLEPGTSQSHDFHSPGDRDYVSFAATRGHVYTLETLNLGASVDTRLFLYDCRGNLLAQDDDGRALEEPYASRLVWTTERTCTHYAMAHDVGKNDAGPGTEYDLRMWEQVFFVEDEYEPDGKPSQATLLVPGELQPHNLHFAGDRDWVRLEVRAGYTYIIETSGLGEAVDTVLLLLDQDGEELIVDDNGREDEEPFASRLRWTAEADGTLYVVVHDKDDAAQGPGTEYWIGLTEISP